MIFYHGTTEDKWNAIQQNGVLWGKRMKINSDGIEVEDKRYTILTPDLELAKKYGDVVLIVNYKPIGKDHDDYQKEKESNSTFEQFSVFVPIPLMKIKRLL